MTYIASRTIDKITRIKVMIFTDRVNNNVNEIW